MFHRSLPIAFAIGLVILLCYSSNGFSQCGTHFKTGYRAVDKVNYSQVNGSFILADWTGDGRSDFWGFRPNQSNSAVNIVIYPAVVSGYWNWNEPITLATTLPLSTTTVDGFFVIRDFNSDGLVDLFRFDSFGNGVIHKNTGTGSLAQLAINNSFGNYVGFGDINGDGLVDWIDWIGVPNQGNSFGYRLLSADGTFGPRVDVITNIELVSSGKATGDFNGDGRPDLLYSAGGRYTILLNTGGGFGPGVTVSGRPYGLYSQADVNNDARTDYLAATLTSPQRLFVLIAQSNGTLNETEVANVSDYLSQFQVTELNGDNNKDILQFNENRYTTYMNNGSGNFVKTDYFKSIGATLGNLVFEDFSGDKKADLWDRGQVNLFNEVVIIVKENTCQSFGETKRANFDGNYYADIAAWDPASGRWSSENGDWPYPDAVEKVFSWGSASLGDVPSPGDFDGDGRTDYSVFREPEGKWYIFLTSTSTWLVSHFGLQGDIAVPDDYDGGGRSDIAVFRPSEGNWYIWYSETQSFAAGHFGSNGDKPVPADFDGDGRTDVAVFRPSEGNWYWLRSSDLNWGVARWGISTDVPIPADFDGDGRADITVFRDGLWYILRSSNGSFSYVNWGTTGDIPMAIYREGDLADFVVYRPSQRWWYNLRYSVGFVNILSVGGTSDVPVRFGLPNN